jgi:hypothetical protein
MKNKSLNILRLIFIALYFYTGGDKLLHYTDFISDVKQSPILKNIPISLFWFIPLIELITAFLLMTKRWRLVGFYASAIMMGGFTFYLILLSRIKYFVPCDCGGFLSTLPIEIHLTLNSSLLFLAIIGIWLSSKNKTAFGTFFAQKSTEVS